MDKIILKIEKLLHCAGVPEYKTEGASGMDLYASIDAPITLAPLERTLVPTGIKIELPMGYEAQIRPRSGLAIKHGISLSNCVGTIDADYRGEVCAGLINLSNEPFTINPAERIAQMVIAPIAFAQLEICTDLCSTERGAGGFGSTGI
jgi:dUTP pyrophosphatase